MNLFGGGNHSQQCCNFNAGASNALYGASSTVTPLSLGVQFLIKY